LQQGRAALKFAALWAAVAWISADIPDTSKVIITAQAIATKRNDAALEQIVGRLSPEPQVTAATWQVDRAIPET
jgi:putative Mg2+ transporter-C (MgtC) family protein